MEIVLIAQICSFVSLMVFIAYFTSKMESIRNNKVYRGIFIEVFAKTVNNDIAPFFDFRAEESSELKRLQKIRNIVVAIWWFNFLLVFGFALSSF